MSIITPIFWRIGLVLPFPPGHLEPKTPYVQLLDVPVYYLLIGLLATTIGAVVQGSVGFGLAIVAAPILLLVAPQFVPCSLMFAATVLTFMLFWRERHAVVGREVWISSVSRLATTLPTAYVISVVDQRMFSILFGCAVLMVVGVSFAGIVAPFTARNLAIASGVSGISNTISAIGGPPMALIYQNQKGDHLRGTLSAIFAVGAIISMVCLAYVGEFTVNDVTLGVLLLPGVLLGFWISRYTKDLLNQQTTRPAVLGIAGLSALVILIRALASTPT